MIKKWDKTGVVEEVLGNRQYRIRMEDSGRMTIRNRRFLRPCGKVESKRDVEEAVQKINSRPIRCRKIPERFTAGERR